MAPILLPLRLDKLALPAFKLLQRLHLGRIIEKPDERLSSRAKVLWESAEKLGIRIYEFRLFERALDTFVAFYKNQVKFYYTVPRPYKALSPGFWWMDDKSVMRKELSKQGIPVAAGTSCFRYKTALETFKTINSEVIVKPSFGSRSRHTTVHIKTEKELKIAFDKAKKISPTVIVEQQLIGEVYRATVIGGKLAAVISRNRPLIIGNGLSNVRELVLVENRNPRRSEHGLFHAIPIDEHTAKELERQNLNLNSIPESSKIVYLSDKISRGVGATTEDVTDKAHPDNSEMFEKIAKIVDDDIIGIDFIIEDISKSWKETMLCGVIECNSMPFIDLHHSPFQGKPRDVSRLLWQVVFGIPA